MNTLAANRVTAHNGKKKAYACGYKGCTASFDKPQGLAMHVGRKHTNTIPNAKHSRNGQVVAARLRAQTEEQKPKKRWSAERRARWEAGTTAAGVPSKRKYAKRKYTKRNQTQVVVNIAMPHFCPFDGIRMGKRCDECGLVAADLAVALHTVKKMHGH